LDSAAREHLEETIVVSLELPPNCPVREGDLLAGKYRIESVLGVGGMGVVLQALHVDLGQRVAIKLMLREMLSHPESVARFTREARAAARLQNDHVVRVMDVSRLDSGEPFMVMEHLRGRDMAAVVRAEGAQPVAPTIDRVLQACEAIAEAHAAGIVHRDLKPANLFLAERPDGTTSIKVLDFGISKVTAGTEGVDVNMTATNSLLGSPAFMSPEQMRSAKSVDARSDIWALGVILYELLPGRPAFDAETMVELVARITVDAPTPLRRHRQDLPPDLERAVLSCLEKDPARRPQSIAELAKVLSPFASAEGAGSLSRIRNLLRISGFAGRTLPLSSQPDLPPESTAATAPGAAENTNATFGVTSNRPSKTRWMPIALALSLVAIVSLGFATWHIMDSSRSVSAVSVSAPSGELSVPAPEAITTRPAEAYEAGKSVDANTDAVSATSAAPEAVGRVPAKHSPRTREAGAPKTAPDPSKPPKSSPDPASGGGVIDYDERK
jgi:serine/threonine-protein kinase